MWSTQLLKSFADISRKLILCSTARSRINSIDRLKLQRRHITMGSLNLETRLFINNEVAKSPLPLGFVLLTTYASSTLTRQVEKR
jgi:hypothetical protein